MDYSGRVNSKKGSGGVADILETNVHTKRRLKELFTTQVLDLDNDPYVFRNHLGMLECKLCLTTHVSESSYISHLGGRKHQVNLEKRRILDEKYNKNRQLGANTDAAVSINNAPKRTWNKIGKPEFKVVKIRHPQTLQLGVLISIKYPKIAVDEPFFRFMSYYELTTKNQNVATSYLHGEADDPDSVDPKDWQYLVITAEPYENICFVLPNNSEIDKPNELGAMSESYWWHWDNDVKDFYLQFLYK